MRVENRVEFDKMLNKVLSKYTLDEVSDLLESNKVPCGRVNDLKSMF